MLIIQEILNFVSGVYILPHPIHWHDQNETLVVTPHRNYSVRYYLT
jgi:hypothetical protein